MTQTMTKVVADFNTTLSLKVAVGDTTATLTSATDDDGVALLTGTYGLTIDRKSSSKEFIQCTITGTAVTAVYSVSRQGVKTSGFARTHRKGAEVIISDWSSLKRINDILDGTVDLDSGTPLKYDGTASISTANQLATKAYVDGVAIAGAPDASTTVKGIVKMSTAPVSPTSPIAVGDNDTRVPTQGENDALVGNNTDVAVGTGNKFVTQTGLQHNAEKYAADAGSNDTYVITLSPVPTSYTNGMVVYFKANTANTGAATLNVNSLGAKTIVKGVNTTLADGDIAAGQFCTLIYDGTNFVLQNPVAIAPITSIDLNITQQQINIPSDATTIAYNYITTSYLGMSASNAVYTVSGGSAGSSSPRVSRFIKLGNGSLVLTHTVYTSNLAGNTNPYGICVIGNYVYVFGSSGGSPQLIRLDIADLQNEILMTISGTAMSVNTSIFSDGTNLYNMYTTGTAKKYTISGTTATSSTDTNYTSSTVLNGYWSDGTSLYAISPTATYKWALSGGARTTGPIPVPNQYISSGSIQTDGGGIFKEVGNSTYLITVLANRNSSNPVGRVVPITTF